MYKHIDLRNTSLLSKKKKKNFRLRLRCRRRRRTVLIIIIIIYVNFGFKLITCFGFGTRKDYYKYNILFTFRIDHARKSGKWHLVTITVELFN